MKIANFPRIIQNYVEKVPNAFVPNCFAFWESESVEREKFIAQLKVIAQTPSFQINFKISKRGSER